MTHPPRPSAGLSESPIESFGSPFSPMTRPKPRPYTFVAHEAHPRGEASSSLRVSAKPYLKERTQSTEAQIDAALRTAREIVGTLSATHTRMETCS